MSASHRPPKRLSDRDHAIELLKVAVAALGEEIVHLGASQLTGSAERRRTTVQGLEILCEDARVLSAACSIFLRRPDLLR